MIENFKNFFFLFILLVIKFSFSIEVNDEIIKERKDLKYCSITCNGICSESIYVCNGHGNCYKKDKCLCSSEYSGNFCETCLRICNGICSGESSICGGHGSCTSNNTCLCDSDYYGDNCSLKNSSSNPYFGILYIVIGGIIVIFIFCIFLSIIFSYYQKMKEAESNQKSPYIQPQNTPVLVKTQKDLSNSQIVTEVPKMVDYGSNQIFQDQFYENYKNNSQQSNVYL